MPHRALGDAAIAVAGSAQAQILGASPFSYVNLGPNTEVLYFTVPTGVTATVARGGVALASILTPAATTIPVTILAPPGSTTVFTYSAGAPVLIRDAI